MQKTLILCVAAFIILSAGNCKKNPGNQPPADQGDYQPLTIGSEWNYSTTGTTAAGPVNSLFKLTVLNKDTTVSGGKTYKVFSNSVGQNEYYNKSGNDYNRISFFAALPQPVEVLYLKDNLSLGGSWSEIENITISGFTVPVNLSFVVEKNKFDTTMDGTTYKDVIKVRLTPTAGIPITSDISYYYARNVGLFYNKTTVVIPPPVSINVNTVTKLNSFTIK
ncbi:MAG: hypothetical protein K2Q24_09940 [Chitinophagaceae bacterium]|jgi:hypothetical protein|nr:hypothetical protein [Chitinophagaceae bacterium]